MIDDNDELPEITTYDKFFIWGEYANYTIKKPLSKKKRPISLDNRSKILLEISKFRTKIILLLLKKGSQSKITTLLTLMKILAFLQFLVKNMKPLITNQNTQFNIHPQTLNQPMIFNNLLTNQILRIRKFI